MQQNYDEEMFFEEKEMVIGFSFNQLVDGVVHKLLQAEGQRHRWHNGKQLDEGDMV
jgi:hypothetical protein